MLSRHRSNGRSTISMGVKRNSLHLDISAKKRRKVEHEAETKETEPQIAAPPNAQKAPITHTPSFTNPGIPLHFGVGDTGQLGLGPDLTERSRPARFNAPSLEALGIDDPADLDQFAVQTCAGGMHTVLLTKSQRVVTFGCNDEGALGRPLAESDRLFKLPSDAPDGHNENADLPKDLIADETRPAYVPLPSKIKIIMISAGDSHTAALDSEGQVWLWGTFRGPSGPIGLTEAGEISKFPRRLLNSSSSEQQLQHSASSSSLMLPGMRVVKIASGQDHLVCLTDEGRLYTMGCGEQGQLGRIAERFARTGGRYGIGALLYPTECRVRGSVRFSDAWAGGFATFARCHMTGNIYACGLNNYGQLGLKNISTITATSGLHGGVDGSHLDDERAMDIDDVEDPDQSVDAARVLTDQHEADKSEAALIARQGPLIQFMLTRAQGFDPSKNWQQFAISMHHTLGLDDVGHVYAIGRPDYGRLGLGKQITHSTVAVSQPTRVGGPLSESQCCWIGCGEACSFAVDNNGVAYSWGIGSNKQLGQGDADDDDDYCEPGRIKGKLLEERYVSMIDAGGQHTVLLAHSFKPPTDTVLKKSSAMEISNYQTNTDSVPKKCQNSTATDGDDKVTGHLPSNTLSDSKSLGVCLPHSESEPVLAPPLGVSTVRNSPSSGLGSTTVGVLINSSSLVSDTSSVGSCGSNLSTSSQLNSAKSTDGGGSSRCSSAFDAYSVQSSILPMGPPLDDNLALQSFSGNGSLMPDPLSASLLASSRVNPSSSAASGHPYWRSSSTSASVVATGVGGSASVVGGVHRTTNSSHIRSAGMSICSTSSEPSGLLTDTISLGSMTASPADLLSGEASNN